MPEVRNCKRCGRVYNYIGGAPICPVCKEEDEEDYKRVKQYLYDYPGATLNQVSDELNVSVEKIKRFLKDGRLEIIGDDGNFLLECESCGKSIKTGRFCDMCERNLSRDFKSTAKQIGDTITRSTDTDKSISMRYLNKEQKK